MRYDRHHGARRLAQLQPGERVRVCTSTDSDWSVTGRITEQRPGGRRYVVVTFHGQYVSKPTSSGVTTPNTADASFPPCRRACDQQPAAGWSSQATRGPQQSARQQRDSSGTAAGQRRLDGLSGRLEHVRAGDEAAESSEREAPPAVGPTPNNTRNGTIH